MYQHGVFIQESDTAIVSPVQVNSALPVVIGTAPVHHLGSEKRLINEPKLIFSFADFVSSFGSPTSEENEADVSKVSATDIIGGVDKTANKKTGLSLVQEVLPRFKLVPSQILAPKYSSSEDVALAIDAACENISGHFRAIGLIEMPDNLIALEEVGRWLNTKNLISANLLAMYDTCTYGESKEYGSIHLASVIAKRDSENGSIPFW